MDSQEIVVWLGIFAVVVSCLSVIFVFAYPYFTPQQKIEERIKALDEREDLSLSTSLRERLSLGAKERRKKKIQDSLKDAGQVGVQAQKRKNISALLAQAGLSVTIFQFWVYSFFFALGMAFIVFLLSHHVWVTAGGFFASFFGIPRWILGFLCSRRKNKFLHYFPDAIDIMVRSIRAGLPISEAMRLISEEIPDPVGPEFLIVVEGQRLGITIEQGVQRMYQRLPLAEVNFLAIVMSVQSKTGGNLAEALGNLSRVLRERRKMHQKIKALSQEAKVSAFIIGSLPFILVAILSFTEPTYLLPLIETPTGNILLVISGISMSLGTFVMRQMINFDF